ncbi:hypothetical protein [Flavobacterium undicola]|uniref:hypothetical protein n=1 Tax=Flavobacterium undicola TaxID=1932779 RepID=UPI0013775BA5|nr:hypothetical protein [Flavobacterium undicola]MBA0882571.1 hypothetical protein [Flavobacterium undicola]
MKINLNTQKERKWKLLFVFIFFIVFNMHSQSYLDEYDQLFVKKAKIINYHRPDNYFYIRPIDSYFEIYPTIQQSQCNISMINGDNQIMITVAMIPYPKGNTRAQKYLIATEDLNRPHKKWLYSEMDIHFSNTNLIGVSQLKKINADRGYLYNLKVRKNLYLGIYPRCKKLIVYKDNVGRVEILFFYKYGQDDIVKQEIEKTWGMLKFK